MNSYSVTEVSDIVSLVFCTKTYMEPAIRFNCNKYEITYFSYLIVSFEIYSFSIIIGNFVEYKMNTSNRTELDEGS